MGMGAFLGVAAGSEQPPKFIHLTYSPSGRARRKVAIVGKGVTFDSGGLDLKPADGMLRMKNDMAGAPPRPPALRGRPSRPAPPRWPAVRPPPPKWCSGQPAGASRALGAR